MTSNNYKVLAIGAHPDDLEISCAGTLAKWAKKGFSITMVVATNGELSSPHKNLADKIAAIRIKEFYKAAQLIKAQALRLNIEDGLVVDSRENRIKFIELMQEIRPDIIITHYPDDDHADHQAVSRLVCASLIAAQAKSITTRKWKIKKVYFMEFLGGIGFNPDIYIDITSTLSIKKRMLSKHVSQLKAMKKSYTINLLDIVEATARFRGLQSNVRYAEGFIEFKSWRRTGVSDVP